MRTCSERGSVSPIVLAVVAVAVVVTGGVERLGDAASGRARADAIADLAALAAVTGGHPAAAAVARADGADLVDVDRRGGTTVVVVRHRGVEAVAAARPG